MLTRRLRGSRLVRHQLRPILKERPLTLLIGPTTGDTTAHSYHTLPLPMQRERCSLTSAPAGTYTGLRMGKKRGNHENMPVEAYVSTRQHTSAYVSIRQHTSAYVSIEEGNHESMPVENNQKTCAAESKCVRCHRACSQHLYFCTSKVSKQSMSAARRLTCCTHRAVDMLYLALLTCCT
jgi:hypothetical protein